MSDQHFTLVLLCIKCKNLTEAWPKKTVDCVLTVFIYIFYLFLTIPNHHELQFYLSSNQFIATQICGRFSTFLRNYPKRTRQFWMIFHNLCRNTYGSVHLYSIPIYLIGPNKFLIFLWNTFSKVLCKKRCVWVELD